MKIKKIIIPIVSITFLFLLCAMEENNLLSEQVIQQQSCTLAWEHLKKTPEFINYVTLIKLRTHSQRECKNALEKLHATEAFKRYKNSGLPPFGKSWPPFELEQMEKKS